ncbi:hypothetical protein [Hyphomicrobium sp. ghe19]|uniref:hypothetical protein n=1 Tax=Hyphomicrobium sp. ghe19 TaxID=2682968 RepID=UPI001367716F|nr:hypothetical protein HYPP_01873 [Hyphomicrobium sp. ghe19]
MRFQLVALGFALSGSPILAADSVADLKQERLQVGQAITDARAEQQKYPGGLLGSLIASRLEILKTNDAILQQRVLASEGGARVDIVVSAANPDQKRAEEVAKEMHDLEQRIANQTESAKYSGGLVKGIIESGIATTRLSLEMMRIEYLKAKYGIVWAPALNAPMLPPTKSSETGRDVSEPVVSTGSIIPSGVLLVPTLSHKRYVPHDYRAGNVEDLVVFDVAWDTSRLRLPTRAIKGILVFEDLFGEAKYRIRVTIDDPLKPGAKFEQKELGFRYNQFIEEQQWVRSTDLKNMKVRFEPQEILYADGSGDKF